MTDQEIEQIAVIQARNNCFPPKKNNSPAHNNVKARTSSARNPNIICRYCNKKGHLQKECFSRQRNNAPMVDAVGKPYENNCINNVTDQPAAARPAEVTYEDAHIGSVANLSPYYHLNW